MTLYESVLLVRPDARAERVEELALSYGKLIEQHGGTMVGHELWGLRNLSFPIKKSQRAHYVMLCLDSPPAAMSEMESRLRYDDEILRHLTVRVKQHGDTPSPMVPRKSEDKTDDNGDKSDNKGGEKETRARNNG
ncbi:MAG: 30S ribosomal protein S6, partial [Alphaproteobacteria bacterium]|nr:30S ribosomal protein S6 [Alphaproteobacteria bacterium]